MLNSIVRAVGKYKGNTLIYNTLKVSFLAVFVKVITFFKDILITSYFVFDQILDSFFIGLLIPQFILTVFIYSINSIVIPNYLAQRKNHSSTIGTFNFTCLSISMATALLFTLISLLMFNFLLPFIVSKELDASTMELVRLNFYILLPSVFVSSISSFIGALHNADNHFVFTSLTPVIPVLTTILLLFFVNQLGIFALSIGFTLGYLIELVVMLLTIRRYKISFNPRVLVDNSITLFLKQSILKMFASLFAAGVMIVNQVYASIIGVGVLSMINYSQKIPLFINVVVTMSIGVTILPYFSSKINEERSNFTSKDFTKICLKLFLLASVVCVFLAFFSEWIVQMLFYRGNISFEDIKKIGELQIIYFLQIPFYLVAIISVRLLTALNSNKETLYATISSLIIVFLSNEFLSKYYGMYGIAISGLISVIFNMGINCYLGVRELNKKNR